MANTVSFGQLVDPEQQELDRRKLMIQSLQQSALKPDEQQVVSGRVVKNSPIAGLAKVAQALMAGYMQKDADGEIKALHERRQTEGANDVTALVKALKGSPAQTFETGANEMGDDAATQQVAAQPPDQSKALEIAMRSRNPMVQGVGSTLLQKQLMPKNVVVGRSLLNPDSGEVIGTDATWKDEQAAAREQREATARESREAREQELKLRMEDQRLSREERGRAQKELAEMNIQARKDMAHLAASLRPAAQPPQAQIVTTPEGVFTLGRDGKLAPLIDPGTNKPLTGKPPVPPGKALPVSAAQKLFENNANMRKAQQALDLISGAQASGQKGDGDATGWKGYLPDAILQRSDPKGIATRAAIGDLGSMVIHDRSGAAVTAAEFPRLRPFIPMVTDDPKTAKTKLERFVSEYRAVVDEAKGFYEASGYNVPPLNNGGGGGGVEDPLGLRGGKPK